MILALVLPYKHHGFRVLFYFFLEHAAKIMKNK